MKKVLTLMMAILLTLSLLMAACSDGDAGDAGGGAPPDNQATTPPPESDTAVDEEGDPITELDADDWWLIYHWQFQGIIEQKEDFGALQGRPGAIADYLFNIKTQGEYYHDEPGSIDGETLLTVGSVITIDTAELVDLLLSEYLGADVSGMGFGAEFGSITELVGSYVSNIPYYIDDNGFPVEPQHDENYNYIWPEGKENASSGNPYIQKVASNWPSTIKDKNGQTVQPAAGSYMMYDSFIMEYTGETSQVMVGTVAENVVYNVYLFIVIGSPSSGMGIGDHDAKVYLNLTTSEYHDVWLEGSGKLSLIEGIMPGLSDS